MPSEQESEAKWPELFFHARVMTGFDVVQFHPENGQTVADETVTGYFLEQAVVEVEARLSKRLELELGFNVRSPAVRSAFINYRVEDALQLRVGRFKRPFSRMELRSRGRLPFRSRGLFNELLTDGNFAGRALGAMVWGKPTEQLRYAFAVMDPTPIGTGIEGADVIARVVYNPTQGLSLGLGAMHKWSEVAAEDAALNLNALGVDAKLELGKLEISFEADAAQNPSPPAVAGEATSSARTPWAFGVIGYATYTFKLSKKWALEPVLALEWMDPDTEYTKDERIRAVSGLSWNYRKNSLRVMPQVEIKRPTGDADVRGEIASETYYLMLSAEI